MIVPVILCGGAGTRLWPASREDAPKPFLPLVAGASTFDLTLDRVSDAARFAAPVVMANVRHRGLIAAALAAKGIAATILLEPEGRDTTAAIAAATTFVAARDPNATVMVLPADHVIRDQSAFRQAVVEAKRAADAGQIVVFGVKPDHPATGFGYIRPGKSVGEGAAKAVAAFVEKPDATRAAALISEGCLWNAGIFLFAAATGLSEIARHAPEIAAAANAAVSGAREEGGAFLLAPDAFAAAPRKSFDYAVMEKTAVAAVVSAAFDWSDLGAWSPVWAAAPKDAAGNVAIGDTVLLDARNSYVSSETQRVGVVGLDDVVVVAGNGSVLVTTRARSGDVKRLVEAFETRPEKLLGDFVRHYRPWGNYQALDAGALHQVKRIVVDPGKRLSLQKHARRAEHWTVVEGEAEITVGMTREALTVTRAKPGTHVHIPLGAIHRLANPGATPVVLIEVQIGDYLGEDDIVRLEDDFGRSE